MQIFDNLHLIRKEFQVTQTVKRYINIYLIIGQRGCYLIDSGVAGSEKLVEGYLNLWGKNIKDIDCLFLTHSHPDHIGGANRIEMKSKCNVYAPRKELPWIENIYIQFNERPIPNFFKLLMEGVVVDVPLDDGMTIELEEGLTLKCIETPGHSHGSMTYVLNDSIAFIGDSVPTSYDIPIFTDYDATVNSIQLLRRLRNVQYFCPAWDEVYDKKSFVIVSNASLKMLRNLKRVAEEVEANTEITDSKMKVNLILEKTNLIQYAGNPLVEKSINACLYK